MSGLRVDILRSGTQIEIAMDIELDDSITTGDLGIFHLRRLWSRCLRDRHGMSKGNLLANEWALDNVIYHGLSLPIEETLQYLYQSEPSFSDFENWVVDRNSGVIQPEVRDRINAAILGLIAGEDTSERTVGHLQNILSDNDISFWNENGYIVASGVYSGEEISAAVGAVWEFLKMDPDDPDSWYKRPSDHGIMVQLFHHPALEALRRSPRLKSVFAQIWNTGDLWISTDRVSFNPPERPGHRFPGPHLHWDVSLDLPIPFGVQGLIYLTDTEAEQGAFSCVPGFHNRIESWLNGLAPGVNPRDKARDELKSVPIAGRAGDVVIWHQALPHGSRPNRRTHPRIVLYVTMFPSDAMHSQKWR